MIVILDNRDSFVFNIARYIRELGHLTEVVPTHDVCLQDIKQIGPTGLIISPGPCTPKEAGISVNAVKGFAGALPILGVCLGHQCIGQAFGSDIVRASEPRYGQSAPIAHDGSGLFAGLNTPLTVGLYHSLIVRETPQMSAALDVTARSPAGEIMALAHKKLPIWGVQFHPESILTEQGYDLFDNFLSQTHQETRRA